MYRIGELAKLANVTPDTIRFYEKEHVMKHNNRTNGGFRLYTYSDLQILIFIRYARDLGFTLEVIRNLLVARNDPEHYTFHELKCIIQTRLNEVEVKIAEQKTILESLQELNNIKPGPEHNILFFSFFEELWECTGEYIPIDTPAIS